MSEPSRIVFGVDFSEMTDAVIAAAIQAGAGRDSVQWHAVCVLDPGLNVSGSEIDKEEESKLKEALQARIASSSEAPTESIECHVRVGSVASEIAELAQSLQADLIVVGRHGSGGIKPFLVGSAPVRLLQLTHCSVLVVQPASYQ